MLSPRVGALQGEGPVVARRAVVLAKSRFYFSRAFARGIELTLSSPRRPLFNLLLLSIRRRSGGVRVRPRLLCTARRLCRDPVSTEMPSPCFHLPCSHTHPRFWRCRDLFSFFFFFSQRPSVIGTSPQRASTASSASRRTGRPPSPPVSRPSPPRRSLPRPPTPRALPLLPLVAPRLRPPAAPRPSTTSPHPDLVMAPRPALAAAVVVPRWS